MAWPNKKKAPDDYFTPLIHPVNNKPCSVPPRGWRNPSATMQQLIQDGLILFGEDESTQPRRKYLLEENMYENLPSLLYYGGSDTDLLEKLKIPFDTPKVVNVCIEHIQSFTNKDEIVLDFFSGSATSAHAVLQINAISNLNLKFIHIQVPEATDSKSIAFEEGYKNICEIGKDRIRRAAIKIQQETSSNIDYGFRVYKLDDSNMQDVYYKPQDYKQANLELFSDNVKTDRTADDLLAQVMLDWGLPLSLKIDQVEILGKQVFKVAENSLYACFDKNIDEQFAKELASSKPLRVVFRDAGFKDDTAKTNVKQLLKQLSPETEMKVI